MLRYCYIFNRYIIRTYSERRLFESCPEEVLFDGVASRVNSYLTSRSIARQ